MKMRKQVYELSVQDLFAHSVWEFALDEEHKDGQDESTVRPYRGRFPLYADRGMYAVRTEFTLADGTQKIGYLIPPPDGVLDLSVIQPVIVTEHGQVMLWYGAFAPGVHILNEYYRRLGKNSADVFPVNFITEAPLATGPIEGTAHAFLYFQHQNAQAFAEKRFVEFSVK